MGLLSASDDRRRRERGRYDPGCAIVGSTVQAVKRNSLGYHPLPPGPTSLPPSDLSLMDLSLMDLSVMDLSLTLLPGSGRSVLILVC